jgi:hypothetical protein
VRARPEKNELCVAAPPHRRERGGQLFGVRKIVERTQGDNGREVRKAEHRARDYGVLRRKPE